jgi:hypothetical protein
MKKVFLAIMITQALFWLGLGIFSSNTAGFIINVLMILDGAAFAFLAFFYNKNLFLKISTGAFLLINTVLTFTDQMGLYDYIILAANIACIALFTLIAMKYRTSGKKS